MRIKIFPVIGYIFFVETPEGVMTEDQINDFVQENITHAEYWEYAD